jgi:hypothetical protein
VRTHRPVAIDEQINIGVHCGTVQHRRAKDVKMCSDLAPRTLMTSACPISAATALRLRVARLYRQRTNSASAGPSHSAAPVP